MPTVSDILELPPVRRAEPKVRAGHDNLGRPVRWVHVSEVVDIAGLLEGGELILSTGIALPEQPEELRRFVQALDEAQVAALGVELGRRYRASLPRALVDAAGRVGLPLIELRRETPFVAITQAVHTAILDVRMQDLIASDEAHTAFTALTLAGHGPQEVVDLVAAMSGRPVVYENLVHQVLAFNSAGAETGELLADWEHRSRAARLAGSAEGWLVVDVTSPTGGDWGRLIMLCDGAATQRQRMLLERGATTLVINRLTVRDIDSLQRQTHRTLLTSLALATELPSNIAVRSKALGVPLERRKLTGVVVRASDDRDDPALLRDIGARAVAAAQALKIPALVGPLDDRRVALLLSQDLRADVDGVLMRLSERLHAITEARSDAALVIAVGTTVVGVDRAPTTLREAMQVAESAPAQPQQRPYLRPDDLRLRGLLYALREEPIVQAYAERELRQLLAHDATHGTHLYEFLASYCRFGGNKTATSAELFVSRPALYDRIAKVEKLLGVDLADPEVVLALHFAVLAREAMRRPTL